MTGNIVCAKTVSTTSRYAWKVAYPYVATEKSATIRFVPIVGNNPTYGLIDKARCAFNKLHRLPPYDYCGCGFNAWQDISVALTYGTLKRNKCLLIYGSPSPKRLRSSSLLYVRLKGDVLEGALDAEHLDEWGYRAEQQQVADMFFSDMCEFCGGAAAVGFSLDREIRMFPEVPGAPFSHLKSSCEACSCGKLLLPQQLMDTNDVGIHIGYPSE